MELKQLQPNRRGFPEKRNPAGCKVCGLFADMFNICVKCRKILPSDLALEINEQAISESGLVSRDVLNEARKLVKNNSAQDFERGRRDLSRLLEQNAG